MVCTELLFSWPNNYLEAVKLREVVDVQSLDTFKTLLDGALSTLTY